ncbi:MAG: hypothetical protein QXJ19_03455 [Candidatus Bathyarchaeia archaeon]
MGRLVKYRELDYGVGAFIVFAISLGLAAIVYGGGFLAFNLLNLVAWIIIPLGAYTVAYALRVRKDYLYYMSWGLIMLISGLSFALYKLMNVIVLIGLLLIILAVSGLLAYWRSGEERDGEDS